MRSWQSDSESNQNISYRVSNASCGTNTEFRNVYLTDQHQRDKTTAAMRNVLKALHTTVYACFGYFSILQSCFICVTLKFFHIFFCTKFIATLQTMDAYSQYPSRTSSLCTSTAVRIQIYVQQNSHVETSNKTNQASIEHNYLNSFSFLCRNIASKP